MTWPLEPQGVLKFAEGLDLILVIEEKRSLIETQVKEQLYDLPQPAARARQEGRERAVAVPGQVCARSRATSPSSSASG